MTWNLSDIFQERENLKTNGYQKRCQNDKESFPEKYY